MILKSLIQRIGQASLLLVVTFFLFPCLADALSSGDVGTWNNSNNSLPQALDDASTVENNGYVYLFGGTNSNPTNTVYSAPLNSDGSVGAWATSSNSLPQAISNATSVVYNGYVYVMGGGDVNGNYVNTIYYAKLSSNGSIGTWATSSNSLPQQLYKPTSVVYNGYVYVMGGETNSGYSNIVYSAPLNNAGLIGSWNTSANLLPQGATNSTAVVHNGYVYVMGGNNNGTYINSDYYAQLGNTGSAGSWNNASNNLPQNLKGATSIQMNGYVYVMGGLTNSNGYLNNVYYAKLASLNTANVSSSASSSISLSTPSSTNITCSSSVPEASLVKQDIGYGYPLGLFNLCFETDYSNNPVVITFVTSLKPSQVVARDYNIDTHVYTDIPGGTIIETTYNGQPALQLNYNIVDNGPLDSNSIMGLITDPVGLAVATTPDTGYGTPVTSNSLILAMGGLSILSIGFGIVTLYRRPSRDDK
jgi:N-acetylneuraminic acid mutarotase